MAEAGLMRTTLHHVNRINLRGYSCWRRMLWSP